MIIMAEIIELIQYELDHITIEEVFSQFSDKSIDKLMTDITNITGNNTIELFNKLNTRLPFNIAMKDTAGRLFTKELNTIPQEGKTKYYNYVIGCVPSSPNTLIFRLAPLKKRDVLEYFSEIRSCQLEWLAGIKHLKLAHGLTILFSGVMIINHTDIIITPSSGQWAINMYLLLHPDTTMNTELQNGFVKKKEDAVQFLITLNDENNKLVSALNATNIAVTSYVVHKLINRSVSNPLSIAGGSGVSYKTIKSSFPSLKINPKCFYEYYELYKNPSKRVNTDISSVCKDDVVHLKGEEESMKRDVVQLIKSHNLPPIIELLLQFGNKKDIEIFLREKNMLEPQFQTQLNVDRFVEKNRSALKSELQNYSNTLKGTDRYKYNDLYQTFENLALEPGGIKQVQEKLCMIGKNPKIKADQKQVKRTMNETRPQSQTVKKQRNSG